MRSSIFKCEIQAHWQPLARRQTRAPHLPEDRRPLLPTPLIPESCSTTQYLSWLYAGCSAGDGARLFAKVPGPLAGLIRIGSFSLELIGRHIGVLDAVMTGAG